MASRSQAGITCPAVRARYPLPFGLVLLPCALACLVFLASCGGGSDEPEPEVSYTSRYPALATYAAMDEEDFTRYLETSRRGTDITVESIKSLSVGASINAAESTFNLRSIFDLGQMKADNRLNVDTTGSQQKTELRITTNKSSSSATTQQAIDGSVSGTFAGFKGAAAYHQANAWRDTNSDGTISVQMVSANTNNTVELMSSGFSSEDNFTPYLIGAKLTDAQLSAYISVTESAATDACGGKPYISGLTIKQYKLADTEPYANIQLLSRMEAIFGELRAQHDLCADAAIRTQLLGHMATLRSKIVSGIADFYAFNGDSFVSKTASMNQGIGKGQLDFHNADGNTEAQYGASLSGQYQALAFGLGATGAFQYYKQNGWASALQNVQVSAESWPAGVADTTAWVTSLYTMLKDQNSSLVPPLGSLPKDPGLKLPEPVGPKKAKQDGPPDSVFASYADWKQYQEDKKKGTKDAEEVQRAYNRVDDGYIEIIEEIDNLKAGQDGSGDAYLRLVAELDDLNQRASALKAPPQAGAGSDNSLVRFDKMFVNGFETLPYDSVIPQLRPNLDIPGVDKIISSFPLVMEVMMLSEKLGKLDSYLRFLANISVSNVTPEMSTRYHQFFQTASSRAYDLVGLALSQGTDISAAVYNGYKKAMFGTEATKAQSEMYKNLQDMDYYNYVFSTLLDPVKGKAWIAAPGGYMPMRSTAEGGAEMVAWTSVSSYMRGEKVMAVDFGNPNTNPLSFFGSVKTLQTPWYPVYIFRQAQAPTLVFVQNFGAYQAIYGAQWTVRPYDDKNHDTLLPPSLLPKWPTYEATSPRIRQDVASSENSLLNQLSWNYSVNFPRSGDDPARLKKFNMLVLAPQTSGGTLYHEGANSMSVRFVNKSEGSTNWIYTNPTVGYDAFSEIGNPSGKRLVRRMSDGTVVDIAQDMPGDGVAYVMLLPLNATTTGESLKQAFNYAPERKPMDIVTSTSLEIINKLALLLE